MAVKLDDGHYAPIVSKKVTHWAVPDADGNGEPEWIEQHDGQGNFLGRQQATDKDGRPVFHYEAPSGFRNFASKEAGSDGTTDTYVKVDSRGRVWRHPTTGAAAVLRPGQTMVEYANGDFEILADDFSRYLFARSHEAVAAPPDTSPVVRPLTADELKTQVAEDEMTAFRAWKNTQAQPKNAQAQP